MKNSLSLLRFFLPFFLSFFHILYHLFIHPFIYFIYAIFSLLPIFLFRFIITYFLLSVLSLTFLSFFLSFFLFSFFSSVFLFPVASLCHQNSDLLILLQPLFSKTITSAPYTRHFFSLHLIIHHRHFTFWLTVAIMIIVNIIFSYYDCLVSFCSLLSLFAIVLFRLLFSWLSIYVLRITARSVHL